jgi:splicing factor U2AF subunit
MSIEYRTKIVFQGFGFCEYIDTVATDAAIDGLHDMELVDKKLIVQRASMGQARMLGSDGQPVGLQIPLIMPTKVLMLLNMVQRDELLDEAEYNGMTSNSDPDASHSRLI